MACGTTDRNSGRRAGRFQQKIPSVRALSFADHLETAGTVELQSFRIMLQTFQPDRLPVQPGHVVKKSRAHTLSPETAVHHQKMDEMFRSPNRDEPDGGTAAECGIHIFPCHRCAAGRDGAVPGLQFGKHGRENPFDEDKPTFFNLPDNHQEDDTTNGTTCGTARREKHPEPHKSSIQHTFDGFLSYGSRSADRPGASQPAKK